MKITKTTSIFLILYLSSLFLVSCKKEHSCVCDDDYHNHYTIIIKDTAKKADIKCQEIEDANSLYKECRVVD